MGHFTLSTLADLPFHFFELSFELFSEEILKYFSIAGLCMFKFVMGPTMGAISGLSILETVAVTVVGMMASVLLFSHVGHPIRDFVFRNFMKKRKLFTKRNRRLVKVWRKYGIQGVAFLTPILFSPIVGTLVAVAFGESKTRIFFYMLASAVLWSFTMSYFLFLIKEFAI